MSYSIFPIELPRMSVSSRNQKMREIKTAKSVVEDSAAISWDHSHNTTSYRVIHFIRKRNNKDLTLRKRTRDWQFLRNNVSFFPISVAPRLPWKQRYSAAWQFTTLFSRSTRIFKPKADLSMYGQWWTHFLDFTLSRFNAVWVIYV